MVIKILLVAGAAAVRAAVAAALGGRRTYFLLRSGYSKYREERGQLFTAAFGALKLFLVTLAEDESLECVPTALAGILLDWHN